MDMWKKFSLGLVASAGLTPTLWAQAVPAPAVPAPSVAPVAAPVAAPAQPQTLWGFLGLSKQNLMDCKMKFCASPFGQLVDNATLPLGAMSGGLITSCCPKVPTQADIDKLPPTSEEGAAARIKKAEAEAKARRAAVRYLGTVDCRY